MPERSQQHTQGARPVPPAGAVLINSPLLDHEPPTEFYDEDRKVMFRSRKRGHLYRLPDGSKWGWWEWERT